MTTLDEHECARLSLLARLEAELRAALCWVEGVTVQLSFYEAAPLFLSEPRQRAKLVRFVLEQARAFREHGSSERIVGWRDDPAMVAVERLTLRRGKRLELLLAPATATVEVPSTVTLVAERHAAAVFESEAGQFAPDGFKAL